MFGKTLRLGDRSDLVRNNWRDLIWWRDVAISKLVQPLMEMRNHGTYILDETWDSLIILDACRYDTFAESIPYPGLRGRLESRTSRATDTGEFLISNFLERKCDDVVYVSANPFADKLIKDRVYKLISPWRTHWDENQDTVLPEAMYRCTVQAARKYPDKRIVSHFIQPHYPYIGYDILNVSKFESAKPEWQQVKGGGYKDRSFFTMSAKLIYAKAMEDKASHLRAYAHNLMRALPYVEKLAKSLPGRTIVTADHGEAFGETISSLLPIKIYGHMPRMRISALTRVPWFVIEPKDKIVISNAPAKRTSAQITPWQAHQ